MNRSWLLILFLLSTCQLVAQDTNLRSIGGILDAYFTAAETTDSLARATGFQNLFTENGSITSVVMNYDGTNRVREGSWQTYLEKTGQYYRRFTPDFVEISREMEYYLEIASVHCIVAQYSKQNMTSKQYKEEHWMQFDLVYLNERWYIDNLLWINEMPGVQIQNALITDTLIYSPE